MNEKHAKCCSGGDATSTLNSNGLSPSCSFGRGARIHARLLQHLEQATRAVSQLLWPDKDREVWFSLGENHKKAYRFGLHQLRNCFSLRRTTAFKVSCH